MFKTASLPSLVFSLLLSMLICNQLVADVDVVTKQTEGIGKSQEAALINAVMEAVQQVEGVNINTIRALRSELLTIIAVGTESVPVAVVNEETSEKILGHIKGYVKSYDVIKSEKTAEGWKVTINATLERYKAIAPERKGMRSIAVLPFRLVGEAPASLESGQLVDKISNELTVEFTQSGKFRVLDRTYINEHMSEVAQMRSPLTSPSESLRLGQKLGADYILVGNISYLALEKKSQSYYGSDFSEYRLSGNIQYRFIEVAPQEIIWADTYEFSTPDTELRDLLKDKTPPQAVDMILSGATSNIAGDILDGIYPVKVLNIDNENTILLNQGGKRLKVGDILNVHGTSQSHIDPDTKLSISTDGHVIARLEVLEVKPKYSVTKLFEGDISKIPKNAITRKSKVLPDAKKNVPPPRQSPGSSDAPADWSR